MGRERHAVVLHGAGADRPDEADTIVQAGQIAASLHRLGWDAAVRALGPDIGALGRLLTPRPSVVFNLVEAIGGDGAQAYRAADALDRLGISYTGASGRAQRDTTDKLLAKRTMRAVGLPTPDWIGPGPGGPPLASHDRWIVKSVCEDASLGIDAQSVVSGHRVAADIAARAARFGGDWFAEAYVDGREFNVGLLHGPSGLDVLPIAEIAFVDFPPDRPRIVDYEAKWQADSFAYRHTPRRFVEGAADAPLLDSLRDLSLRAFRLFGLAGYGRVDFRVNPTGQPWILEVNANPCLTEDAGFMAAAARAGMTPDVVVGRILRAAGVAPAGMVA